MNLHRAAPGWAWLALAHLPAGELPVQASDKGCSFPGGPELSQEAQRVQCMTSSVVPTSHSDLGNLQKPSGKMPTTDFQNLPLPSSLSITPQSIYFLLVFHPAPSLSSMPPSPDRPVLSLCCLSLYPKQQSPSLQPIFPRRGQGIFLTCDPFESLLCLVAPLA